MFAGPGDTGVTGIEVQISRIAQIPSHKRALKEMKEMILHTDLSAGVFASSHASNYLTVTAHFPGEKKKALDLIDASLRGEIELKPEWLRGF